MKTIERLKKLLEVATTGPVLVDHDARPDGSDHLIQDRLVRPRTIAFGTSNGNENDLPLIAESWNALPALLAVVEAAEIIDTMPVDGCSPVCIESMLRQAKTLCNAALRALEGGE